MPHPTSPRRDHARYVTDGIETCVAQAKAAAGGRDILLHGAAIAQECLRGGLLDEMELQLMPVLLGQGRRLFEDLPPDHIELELLRALDGPGCCTCATACSRRADRSELPAPDPPSALVAPSELPVVDLHAGVQPGLHIRRAGQHGLHRGAVG